MPPLRQYFSRLRGRRVHPGPQRARIMDPQAFSPAKGHAFRGPRKGGESPHVATLKERLASFTTFPLQIGHFSGVAKGAVGLPLRPPAWCLWVPARPRSAPFESQPATRSAAAEVMPWQAAAGSPPQLQRPTLATPLRLRRLPREKDGSPPRS